MQATAAETVSTADQDRVQRPATSTQDEGESGEPKKARRESNRPSFREQWRRDFNWLRTDESLTMLCDICVKTKQKKNGLKKKNSVHLCAFLGFALHSEVRGGGRGGGVSGRS